MAAYRIGIGKGARHDEIAEYRYYAGGPVIQGEVLTDPKGADIPVSGSVLSARRRGNASSSSGHRWKGTCAT